jgi:threonine dehydrogenase-like Zn-dependent dehydrogenase
MVLRTIDKTSFIEEVETPEPKNTEILAAPLFVGVCGTDLQIIRRQRPDPATILGHEGIAQIITGESSSKGILPGGYVVFNSVDPTDQDQILGHNTPGLQQQRYLINETAIKNDLAVPFPAEIDPILGALVEPLGTVVYGHSLVSKATKQTSIAIVGAGAIGIMHALYAGAQGYEKVFLINTSQDRLDWCTQRGIVASENVFLDSETLPDEILAATNKEGVDAVYMCTSRPNALAALTRALQYVRPGGCIDLVGGIKDTDTIPELPEITDLNAVRRANFCGIPSEGFIQNTTTRAGKLLFLTGHRGTSYSHFQETIEELRKYGPTFKKVISHIISFEAAPDLFNSIAKGPMKEFNGAPYIKAVVDIQQTGKNIENI